MGEADLESNPNVDLSSVDLTYEGFRRLARNPYLSSHEKIGFPDSYREGLEGKIFEDIYRKIPPLQERGKLVLDIGPGCAGLPHIILQSGAEHGHKIHLIDSPEMLAGLPDGPHIRKHAGAFPAALARPEFEDLLFDAIICYSVAHYLFVEYNIFGIVDTIVRSLAPSGVALIGDIPNISKRRRFFHSEAGQRFHHAFTGGQPLPPMPLFEDPSDKIDDAVLTGMIQRAQAAGCDAYLMPQPADLPMANRRDDLVICRP